MSKMMQADQMMQNNLGLWFVPMSPIKDGFARGRHGASTTKCQWKRPTSIWAADCSNRRTPMDLSRVPSCVNLPVQCASSLNFHPQNSPQSHLIMGDINATTTTAGHLDLHRRNHRGPRGTCSSQRCSTGGAANGDSRAARNGPGRGCTGGKFTRDQRDREKM